MTKMTLGSDMFFLRHEGETYMLRPYHREGYDVSYAAYKQTANGFEKVCCFDCTTDDTPEEVFAAMQFCVDLASDFGDDWKWQEAEETWEKENFGD